MIRRILFRPPRGWQFAMLYLILAATNLLFALARPADALRAAMLATFAIWALLGVAEALPADRRELTAAARAAALLSLLIALVVVLVAALTA